LVKLQSKCPCFRVEAGETDAAHVNKELVRAITNALGFLSLHRPETAYLVLGDVLAENGLAKKDGRG
jgi:hypothetical protein